MPDVKNTFLWIVLKNKVPMSRFDLHYVEDCFEYKQITLSARKKRNVIYNKNVALGNHLNEMTERRV